MFNYIETIHNRHGHEAKPSANSCSNDGKKKEDRKIYQSALNKLRDQLAQHRVITKKLQQPNLDNAIHPIFREANWPTSNFCYSSWKPTLRLASLFLTHPAVQGWWIQAAWGKPVAGSDGQSIEACKTQCIDSDAKSVDYYLDSVDENDENRAKLDSMLLELADRVQFVRKPWPEELIPRAWVS